MIALAGEATYLMKDSVAAAVQGVGWPTVGELLKEVITKSIPIYVEARAVAPVGCLKQTLQVKTRSS